MADALSKNAHLLPHIGFDTAENEAVKILQTFGCEKRSGNSQSCARSTPKM